MKLKANKILVMHTGGWIGDMILLTPALHALRDHFPYANISMLILPLVQELMERNPYINEVIVYDKHNTQKGLRHTIKIRNRIKSEKFDIAIILHPNSLSSIFLAYITGIPRRIYGRFFDILYRDNQKCHEVKRYLDIVSPIVDTKNYDKLEFWGIKDDDIKFARNIIDSKKRKCDNPIIGMNISTTWRSKQWEFENFAKLAEILIRQFDALVLLTGGKDDIELGNKIMSKINDSSIVNLVSATTIWQLGAIIQYCNLYITSDSGPMHISTALGVPTIALFGPTDPARHGPYGKDNTIIKADIKCSPCYKRICKMNNNACMKAIQPEDVAENLGKYLINGLHER